MSEARVRDLFESAARDPELKEQLAEADAVDAFLDIAREHGYDFSVENLETVIDASAAASELGEDDLEQVAGGISMPTLQRQYPGLLGALSKPGVAPLKPAEFNIGMPPNRILE